MLSAIILLTLSKSLEAGGILPLRFGGGNLAWDQAVASASKKADAESLRTILRSRPQGGGFHLATYRYDLYKVFRARPAFFLFTARTHYQGNLDCVLFDLVPDSRLIPYEDLKEPLREAAGTGDAQIARFQAAAMLRYSALQSGKEPGKLDVRSCYPR